MKYNYQSTGIAGLGNIPGHWSLDRLKDLCLINAETLGNNTAPDHIINYLDISNVNNLGIVDFDKIKELSFAEAPSRARRKVRKNDTVISSVRTNLQAVAYINFKRENLVCSTGFFVCRPKDKKLNNKFLYYLLLTEFSKDYFFAHSVGVSYPAIDDQKFGIIHLPLPPLKEQKAIADYLEKTCERIDKIVSIKEEQLRKINKYKKNRIDEVVRFGLSENYSKSTGLDYLPKINNEWDLDRFKDLASLRLEKSQEKTAEENYVELEDLDQGTGKLLSTRNTSEVASKVTIFYKGDVLFGKLRPYLEKYHYAEFDGKCTGEILAFKPIRIEGKFLTYIVGSNWFISLCNSMAYGAKMPRVNWNTQLSKIYLPLPSKREQLEIIKYLDVLSEKTYETIGKLKNQIKTLKKYRKSLIHECVTGKKQVYFEEQKMKEAVSVGAK